MGTAWTVSSYVASCPDNNDHGWLSSFSSPFALSPFLPRWFGGKSPDILGHHPRPHASYVVSFLVQAVALFPRVCFRGGSRYGHHFIFL